MDLKTPLLLASLLAAGNLVSAQSIPEPRPVSAEILETNRLDSTGNFRSWPTLPEKDIEWKRRVWRDIDTKDHVNELFRSDIGERDYTLVNTLVAGVMNGSIKAYKDERFSAQLLAPEVAVKMKAVANNTSPGPDQAIITKYRIKEDSVHLRDENRTEIRIVGIAPVIEGVTANGDKLDQELFWVYYIDALNYLAQSPAPVRPGITWADVLQGRSFYGKTIKMNDRTTTPEIKEKPSKPR